MSVIPAKCRDPEGEKHLEEEVKRLTRELDTTKDKVSGQGHILAGPQPFPLPVQGKVPVSDSELDWGNTSFYACTLKCHRQVPTDVLDTTMMALVPLITMGDDDSRMVAAACSAGGQLRLHAEVRQPAQRLPGPIASGL